MDPGEVLTRGRTAALDGRHQEALRDLVWFHEHALEHDRAYYGVRLSFALGYWRDLADEYPPAMEALLSTKRITEAKFASGEGDRHVFRDIVALNRELGRVTDTYHLFLRTKNENPTLAKQCADLAIDAIVELKDFRLAAEYLPHPESYLLWLSERLNDDLTKAGRSRRGLKARREADVRNYCHDVRTALQILRGLRNSKGATAALIWAIALVERPQERAMVCKHLTAQ